jgi:hypothetical protein
MTMIYLDTEFNGFGGGLISLALVGMTGEQFYEVCELPANVDIWVKQHVVPVLGKEPMRPLLFRQAFQQWIVQFDNPEIVCDWHVDAQHFCEMLAGFDYGSSLDFAFTMRVLKTPPGQPISKVPHNALADAVALMEWHQDFKQWYSHA